MKTLSLMFSFYSSTGFWPNKSCLPANESDGRAEQNGLEKNFRRQISSSAQIKSLENFDLTPFFEQALCIWAVFLKFIKSRQSFLQMGKPFFSNEIMRTRTYQLIVSKKKTNKKCDRTWIAKKAQQHLKQSLDQRSGTKTDEHQHSTREITWLKRESLLT